MKIAFLYAGQGSQCVGMGKSFYEEFESFRNIFDLLSEEHIKLCFEGPIEELSKTENTQPCMVAFAAGVTEILKEKGILPQIVAGLSLGEYSALYGANVFGAKTVIDIAEFRGKVMSDVAKDIDSSMVAVLQLNRDTLQECCDLASDLGVVEIANYNCPQQLVIGGETKAVKKASELALNKGARRVLPLLVSGPFHTSLMGKAAQMLKEKFVETSFSDMDIPVVFNSTAKELQKNETIADMLEKQVKSSVYFEDTINYLSDYGVDVIIEIGPGKVLSGFVKKTKSDIKVFSVEDIKTLESTLTALSV
ncbi:MAG: ACP S-malonyltransferase [Oscillospiraceae bacterium]